MLSCRLATAARSLTKSGRWTVKCIINCDGTKRADSSLSSSLFCLIFPLESCSLCAFAFVHVRRLPLGDANMVSVPDANESAATQTRLGGVVSHSHPLHPLVPFRRRGNCVQRRKCTPYMVAQEVWVSAWLSVFVQERASRWCRGICSVCRLEVAVRAGSDSSLSRRLAGWTACCSSSLPWRVNCSEQILHPPGCHSQ